MWLFRAKIQKSMTKKIQREVPEQDLEYKWITKETGVSKRMSEMQRDELIRDCQKYVWHMTNKYRATGSCRYTVPYFECYHGFSLQSRQTGCAESVFPLATDVCGAQVMSQLSLKVYRVFQLSMPSRKEVTVLGKRNKNCHVHA